MCDNYRYPTLKWLEKVDLKQYNAYGLHKQNFTFLAYLLLC
jgi:hypothetical protein